jgi:hypothetical protein
MEAVTAESLAQNWHIGLNKAQAISYEAIMDVPIAMVATAWDDPATGEATVLYIHEALYFGDKMSHTLLCPNQL